jgi:hypothetical protein
LFVARRLYGNEKPFRLFVGEKALLHRALNG